MLGQNERKRPTLRTGPCLDVLVATKGDRQPQGLTHLLGTFRYVENTEPGWAHASNALLDQAERDALFIDDDVTLTADTFALLNRYWDKAEVFGFTLLYPEPERGVQSAGYEFGRDGQLWARTRAHDILTPGYVPHVTASCMIVKHEVLEAGIRFPDWPGVHSEDVAFTLDCWLHGFRVLYLPGVAYHDVEDGAGATKRHDANLTERQDVNKRCLYQWAQEHGVSAAIQDGRIPFGTWRVEA